MGCSGGMHASGLNSAWSHWWQCMSLHENEIDLLGNGETPHIGIQSNFFYFFSPCRTALPLDGMNIKWMVSFYWEQIHQSTRPSRYYNCCNVIFETSVHFIIIRFEKLLLSLSLSNIAPWWFIQVGSLLQSQPGEGRYQMIIPGADCET